MLNETLQLAAAGGAGQQEAPQSPIMLFLPWIIIFGIFYLLIFRPQRVKQKENERMRASLQKGDKIVTAGGIVGTIVNLKEKTVSIKVADNVRIEILRTSVSRLVKSKGEAAQEKQAGQTA